MATAILQTAWDCRWSRPGHRITGFAEEVQPESVWVCVRDGDRRNVSDAECASCSRWKALRTAATAIALPASAATILTDRITAAPRGAVIGDWPAALLRAVLVMIAVAFAAIGVAILTAPLAIPFTVALWLCAAAALGLAAFGVRSRDERSPS